MSVERSVLRMISDQIGEEVTDISKTKIELGLDSLDELELVMQTEDEFDVELHDCDLEKVSTINGFIALIKKGRNHE